MSIGDIKGARRRFKKRQQLGHAPKPNGLSIAQSIERNREVARRQLAVKVKK